MQFQHGTQILPPANSRIGVPVFANSGTYASGQSFALLSSSSPSWQFSVQQVFASWTGVTTAGNIAIQYSGLTGRPFFIINQTTGAGNLVLPMWNVLFGNFGLEFLNNSSGGSYSVSVFYTLLST